MLLGGLFRGVCLGGWGEGFEVGFLVLGGGFFLVGFFLEAG